MELIVDQFSGSVRTWYPGEILSIYNQKAGMENDLCFNSGIAEYDHEKHPSAWMPARTQTG